MNETDLADDLLEGAEAIAVFLYRPTDDESRRKARRKIYHLLQEADSERERPRKSQRKIPRGPKMPIFRLGTTICARKSAIQAWIEAQETA